MTLRKLLTGNPGNKKELVEMAKEHSSAVDIQFKMECYCVEGGYGLDAEVVYSIDVNGKTKSYSQSAGLPTGSMYGTTRSGLDSMFEPRLSEKAKKVIKYLEENNVEYNFKEPNYYLAK